ncbi:hypothetical protein ACWPKO_30695 (plasmid) [Coraliomargarita sp. W4R53]
MTEGSTFPRKVDRDTYPRPEYRFPNVKVETYATDSTADYPQPQSALIRRPAPIADPDATFAMIFKNGQIVRNTL